MHEVVMSHVDSCDIFLGVAAVADYYCTTMSSQKIAKTADTLTLTFARNPDILGAVAALKKRPYTIGFAAETENLVTHAEAKLRNKKLDMIIANEVGEKTGFDQDDNAVVVITHNQKKEFAMMPKQKLARELIALISKEVK
jgi:phosphopantothenoylcysteine decarboxylase/phosphopantothenate--cysteine ligase